MYLPQYCKHPNLYLINNKHRDEIQQGWQLVWLEIIFILTTPVFLRSKCLQKLGKSRDSLSATRPKIHVICAMWWVWIRDYILPLWSYDDFEEVGNELTNYLSPTDASFTVRLSQVWVSEAADNEAIMPVYGPGAGNPDDDGFCLCVSICTEIQEWNRISNNFALSLVVVVASAGTVSASGLGGNVAKLLSPCNHLL